MANAPAPSDPAATAPPAPDAGHASEGHGEHHLRGTFFLMIIFIIIIIVTWGIVYLDMLQRGLA